MPDERRIAYLREKNVAIPAWGGVRGLVNEYDSRRHPVMDRSRYPDIVRDGYLERVTRVPLNFQMLATKRMSELVSGIPVKRVYSPANERQTQIAAYMEAIYGRVRINSVNTDRCQRLFAGCEIFTLWYATEQRNNYYGFDSPLRIRCRTFSPMLGDSLYPWFDEYGDLKAMSIGYTRKEGENEVTFFDTYTDCRHIKWTNNGKRWVRVEDEEHTLGKIPGVYISRPAPIWENTSELVYEMEWELSRNGNFLRDNAKPRFVVYSDEIITYGDEKSANEEFKSVMQYPQGARAEYITWLQAVDSLKYQTETLRSLFFTQLQLPDWSYEKMSQQALSGESRKQMFIDAELKVTDESGALIEGFDREVNVVKTFLKACLGVAWHADIDALQVTNVVTPYRISDSTEQVQTLMMANGNKPLMSQRESIERYGQSPDVAATLEQIRKEEEESAVFGNTEL